MVTPPGYDGDLDFTVDVGLGPEIGASSYGGVGSGTNEGGQVEVGSAAVDFVGVYGKVGGPAAGGYGGGGGVGFGAEGGCSASVSYTFQHVARNVESRMHCDCSPLGVIVGAAIMLVIAPV